MLTRNFWLSLALAPLGLLAAVLPQSEEPVLFKDVKINDPFWTPRIEANRTGCIPANYKMCKETGRLDSFKPEYKGGRHIFWDSDVAKWLEAGYYSLQTTPDPELQKILDEVVKDIIAMQETNGYLNSFFHYADPKGRWQYLRHNHELYCAGHLMEAAVAHYYTTGKRDFLDCLCRYADHICETFGTKEGQMRGYPGHEEIELALVKLYKATGNKKYLDQALYFLDERGKEPLWFALEEGKRGGNTNLWERDKNYHQVHKPVREQDEAVGHAVRALYLYSGMADVARETGDESLLAACKKLWSSVCERKMYITGGAGPYLGNEGFEGDYVLPTSHICNETCAGIANAFFCHRMLTLTGEAKYADILEKIAYNNGLSGVSLDGKSFFYNNQLLTFDPEPGKPRDHMREGHEHPDLHRREWFGCSCCPPNQARFVASIGGYIYAKKENSVYVNLFIGSETTVPLKDNNVKIQQKTNYPWDGQVTVSVDPEKQGEFEVALRHPYWCRQYNLFVNGQKFDAPMVKGYLVIKRNWKKDDEIKFVMDMPVERVYANPNSKELKGRVALQRGPVVYCLETCDNVTNDLDKLMLPRDSKIEAKFEPNLLGGVVTLSGKAFLEDSPKDNSPLYTTKHRTGKEVDFKAVPYYAWDNREPGSVIVWLREE